YRIDEDGTRHQTRVWSDPLERDTDGDQLSDLQERLLTFNPNVVDDPSVVENLIQIEEFEVSERTAPIAIWDFDESENATAFADRSGASHTASCDEAADSCPTAGVDGRYGQALDFDGTNDAIAATLTGPLANSSFTISAWAKRDSTGNWDVILNQGQNVLNKGLHLGFRSNNRFTCAFAGNDLTTSVAYTDTDWHHWACTYDVDTNERILYRDGVSVANDAPTGVYEGTGALIVGAAADSSFGNHHFDGMIDEVAIYNDAFTPEMILGLAKGGYYLDDLYVLPGATLDYQVTITNSHTLGATGILFNEANTYRPIEDAVSIDDSNRSYEELIAPPDVVLHLDATEFITTYVNSTQDTFSATCGIDNCPTPAEQVECNISLGNKDRCPSEPPNPDEIMPPVGSLINPTARYAVPVHGLGEFMTFDGVDDMLSIPHMAISPDVVIGFWVRFESLPSNSNEKAYLLSSESEDGYSLYVDHNGSIFFEYGGQSTQLNDVSSNGPIQVVPGKWQHLVLKTSNERSGEFKLTSPYDDFSIADGDSYIIGEDFLSQSLSKIDSPQFGPGLIGNNAAGDGPFHGQITALALYHSPITAVYKVFDVFNNDNNWYSWRENARFTFDGGCDTGSETCKISPTLLLAFEDWGDDSLVTLENSVDGGDAYCETAASCPQPSTTTRDQYNEALVFDNNDRLLLDGINLANQSFTIAVWAKRDTIGSSDYIFGQGEDTESLGLHIGFRSNNKFTCAFWNDGLTTSTAYTDTDWHHWICSYDAETNLRQIFRDGVLVASNSASADYQGSGPFNIGSRFDENHYFDGSLDEIIIIPDAITEDNIQIGEAGTGAMVLASSRYPYVDITTEVDTDYQAFTLLSHESVTLSGSLEIDANLPSHVQRFNQQIDATIDIEEDLDVADGTNVVFYLPFNEDLSNLTDGSCVVGCPLGGFAGVNGRSALFDGDDDALKIENGVPTGTAMTFAAWVKADHGTIVDMREMHGRSIGDFTGWDGLEIDVDVVKLHGRNSTVFVPYSLPNNEWAHLTVVVNKGINWTVDAYVNGVHTGDTGSVAAGEVDSLGSGLAVVGMQKNMAHLLDGYLDDVYVYNEALNATQVQALYEGSRPILSMHFDETAGETAVVSDFGGVGQPSGPVGIGSEGRLGNGVNFNGESYLTVEGIDELDTLDNAFTIMAWVRPEALDGRQRILAHSRANSNDILSFGFSDKKLVFTTNAAEDYVSLDADIVEGEWQHVAVVFDSNNDATFYVNGGRLDKVNGNAPMNSNSNDDLLIGAAINPQGAISDHYIGDLDELVVYDKALTGGEIAEAFQWQFRTYREVGNAYITIDDDDPVVSLSSSSSLRANVPTWLSVEATDPSSPIRRLEIGQSGLNNSNIVWRDAPVCIDDTDAWCPQFAPAGEGAYQVQFRAVDAVGHFSTSSQTTFYVDATGPTVALDSTYNGQFLDANRPSGLELRWVLPLAGTISDPVISNTSVAGSGVNTETVAIQLIDAAGNIVGNSSQRVSVDAATGSWSVNYQFLTERPFGQYTVELLAEDVLGNKVSEAAQEIGSFWLDESPPTVKFLEGTVLGVPFDPYLPRDVFGDAQGVAPEIISEALTLEGVVTNGTEWPGAVAQYHFEDDEITTRIQDTSGTTHHATCDNCPQLGTGLNHFGQALDLTNQNTTVVVPHLVNPGTESFTAMAWFNASSIGGGSQVLIAQQDNEGTGRSWIYLDGAGRVSTFLGGQGRGSSFVVGADKWHHVAITYNGDELRLYVDGQVGLNEELESLESTLGDIIIGSHKGQAAQFFNGYIDEVSIYNRALSEEQILAAAQIPQNAIADVQIRVQEVGYAVGGETTTAIDWTSVTVDTTVEQVSKWSYILDNPQLEGYYQIQLRSSDSSGITEGASNIWRGWINRSGPKIDASIVGTEFSFTATDLMLDETTLSHSCDAADVVSMTYGNDAGVLSGEVYELSATCTLPAAGVDLAEVSVCDSFGLCASLNDFFTVETTLGTPIDIDVLANENASFSIETVGEPANGTVSFGSTITYTPAGSYVGEDSFGYTLTDGAGNNKSGIVNVTVICEANNGNLFSRIIACFNNQTEPGTKIIRLTSDVEVGDDINVLGVANYDKNIELIIDGAGYTVERSGSDKLLFLVVGSKVTFENLTFANVSSINSGGALGIINGSTVNVNNSSFINNQAVDGSAIYIENGTINIDSSTFDGNVAAEGGGAIYNETAAMSITNSTFTNNSAVNQGGAIYNEGQLTIEHSTLSGNSGANGGGIYTSNGNLLLVNTIVANSTSGGDCRSAAPISVDSGYNLISQNGTDACGLENGTNGNLTGVDPLLMPLADNGGDTLTIAIPANSPAVDAGDMSRCATFDQRGVERPFGNGCDIGAFEENIGDVATNNAPIVYYPINDFNGSTITDESGNGHIGGLFGNIQPSNETVTGSGWALTFDGYDDYVYVDDHNDLDLTGDMTIALWARPFNWYSGNHTALVVKGEGESQTANYYFGSWTDGALKLSYFNQGWHNVRDNSEASYNDGQWYHLTVVVDATNDRVRFYRDGILLSEQSHNFSEIPMVANGDPLILGHYLNSNDAKFVGMLDDVLIYDRALTSEEVGNIYNSGGSPLSGTAVGTLPVALASGTLLTLLGGFYLYNRSRKRNRYQ
ncbi:MAG: LamG-like jellyroll fold domain-containing protein, partial [Chloroflexota bacterium]